MTLRAEVDEQMGVIKVFVGNRLMMTIEQMEDDNPEIYINLEKTTTLSKIDDVGRHKVFGSLFELI